MSIRFRFIIIFVCTAMILSGCYYSHPNKVDHWAAATEGSVDSVNFFISHHYWTGYNFQTTDTIAIQTAPPLNNLPEYGAIVNDTLRLAPNNRLVVARIIYVPTDTIDSVWVKVARDQLTQGWLHEKDLLDNVVPDDPISKFIYYFSDSRLICVLSVFGLVVFFLLIQGVRHKRFRIVHFRDIPSFYPTLLCLCVSGSATLYGSIQKFVPNTWIEYYFYPTLNPFSTELPFIMAFFIASVWAILIVAVAVLDELRRQPDIGDNLSYLSSLAGICVVLYLVFTLTTPLYLGYPLLALYWWFAINRYIVHQPSHLLCGVCGKSISKKGVCPHCGAMNK